MNRTLYSANQIVKQVKKRLYAEDFTAGEVRNFAQSLDLASEIIEDFMDGLKSEIGKESTK